jgi:DNA repair protein REV1
LEYPSGTDGLKRAIELRERILRETGCPSSAGVGVNMLLARLATKKAKPNGVYEVPPNCLDYLSDIPLRDLPGVGRTLERKLIEKNMSTCQDVWQHSKATLQQWFGQGKGEWLYTITRGVDDTRLVTVAERCLDLRIFFF